MKSKEKLLLIKPKEIFKEELEEAIENGNAMITSMVSSFDELPLLASSYEEWDRKNVRLLKNSFNIENNEYLKQYNYQPPYVKGYKSRKPSPDEVIGRLKYRIDVRVNRLIEVLHDLPKLNIAQENSLNDKTKLKKMIAENRIQEAVVKLMDFFENRDNENYNIVVLQLSRLNEVKKNVRMGVIDYSEAMKINNQVKVNLIEMIEEMKNE